MDRERPSPSDPLPRASQEGPLLSPETLDQLENPPCVVTPVIESEPLPHDPHCTRVSVTSHASAGDVPSQLARPLHVQFNAQSLPAPVDVSSSSSSSSNDEELSITEPRSPDGGWGWVILLASFKINLITEGITFSFGILLPYFLDYFRERKAGKTVCIGSIFMAMPFLSGPIASFLINKYGLRRMTAFGSILAFLGFFISTFVENIETLFFTIGILAGFGVSLCQVTAVVIVANYFEKKRSLATGISMCGRGIGAFVFDPLTNFFLYRYEWQGTILIFSGCFLQIVVFGLLFCDLPWMTTMNEKRAKETKLRREKQRNKRFGSSAASFSDSKSSAVASTKVSDADIEALTMSAAPQHSSVVDLPTYMTRGEETPLETFELMSSRGRGEEKMPWYASLWNFWDLVMDVLDFSHLRNPAFLVFAASNFLLHMWYHVPYMYSADHILGLGFDVSMISALMSIIGILLMCGDIVLGWMGDWTCVNPSLLYAACMVLCGLAVVIFPLLTTYLGLAAASGVFGFFLAANYSLTSTILVENITLEKFTNAYGLLLLVQGIAYLIGPSLSNWLVIITDSYDLSFYVSGLFIALSGVILTARPLYNAARRSNQRRKQTSTNEVNIDAIILTSMSRLSEDDTSSVCL